MKAILSMMLLAVAFNAPAAFYSYNFTDGFTYGGLIPDGNQTGWTDTRTLSGIADTQITGLSVTLNVSSEWSGDLYAYLTHGTGFIVLMNRVGIGTGSGPQFTYGYGDAGFNVTLSDSGAYAIQNYQQHSPNYNESGQLTGTWQPNDGTTTFGDAFSGLDPNGNWTLFFADMSTGDRSTVLGWSLDITAVPEPTTWALAGFGALFFGAGALRWVRQRYVWLTRNK
jgi:hypothetical protein